MFQSAMFMDLMQQFCKTAHQNAKDKGFWDEHKKELSFTDAHGKEQAIEIIKRPINLGEKYMLMVSELCELFEAHRKNKLTAPCDKDATIIDPASTEPCTYKCQMCAGSGIIGTYTGDNQQTPVDYEEDYCSSCAGKGTHTATGVRRLTNEEEELADIAIRLADYCGYRGIDLGAVILSKMQYNSTRPYMHGKSC